MFVQKEKGPTAMQWYGGLHIWKVAQVPDQKLG